MAGDIRQLPAAKADLMEIWSYIAEHNVTAADRMLDRFQAALQMLLDQPMAGRERPELYPDLRSFPVGRYIVYYLATNDGITVVRVLSALRDVSDNMMQP